MNAILTTGTTVSETSATTSRSALARVRLEEVVSSGVARASRTVERVLSEVPEDRLVPAARAAFAVGEHGPEMVGGRLHDHAFGQLATRAGLPNAYARKLAVGTDRERSLLAHAMGEHLGHSEDRFLVRAVAGQVRGVLSDSYRRLDSRPLLESFIAAATAVGAVPYEGVGSDVRSSLRAIIPTIVEPVPGEAMVFGLAWTNSDFGAGSLSITSFALRLLCLNGAVGASEMRKVHLGARMDDLMLSAQTHELDTKTLASATGDIVRGALGPAAIDRKVEAIRASAQRETTWGRAAQRVAKDLTKAEAEAARSAFESDEVVMLPAGHTAWRASNALSWIANTATDERKLELQQLAGALVS